MVCLVLSLLQVTYFSIFGAHSEVTQKGSYLNVRLSFYAPCTRYYYVNKAIRDEIVFMVHLRRPKSIQEEKK